MVLFLLLLYSLYCLELERYICLPYPPPPHKSQLLFPKIWETRDQTGPRFFSSDARSGNSLGTTL
jgi:hypothetical protein